MIITSVNNKLIKDLMKLKQKKYRQEYYLVESAHLVDEAIKKGVADLIITCKPVNTDIETIEVSKEVMEKLAFTKTPQSIMARCKKIDNDEMIEGSRYLILDSLQDPGNVGTLIRTALAFGIDQVILSHQSVDIYNDKVLRSMQGAHFHLSCIYRDLKEVIPLLQEKGVTVVGSALENGKDIHLLEKKEKMAFVLGNEGNGMSQEIIDICDVIGYIPIDTIESLNVAIAGSIMMYHFK